MSSDPTAADPTKQIRFQGRLHYFSEIESLRGLAIALVFLRHADFEVTMGRYEIGTLVSPLGAFARAGHTGVSLFFVISGFLLSLPFIVEASGGEPVGRSRYFARRALRILPVYYAAVIAGSVLSAEHIGQVWRGLPYLGFLNAVGYAPDLSPYSLDWWSLATEAQFYVLLPLLPWLLRSRRGRNVGVVLSVVYAVAYVQFARGRWYVPSVSGQIALGLSLFGRGPFFAWGIVAAWFYNRHGTAVRERWAQALWGRWTADLVLLGVFAVLGMLLRRVAWLGFWEAEANWFGWHLAEGGLWTAVLLVVLLAPLRAKRVLSNALAATVGTLSYSIYLIHHPLLVLSFRGLRQGQPGTWVGWGGSTLAAIVVMAAGCLALAALSYRMIERPFLARKARLAT